MEYVFISLACAPKSGISGSHGNSVFNLLRNFQTGFQSGCSILHPHQECTNVPNGPHPHRPLGSQAALVVTGPPADAGGEGSAPGPGRPLGAGHGTPLHYSCLENAMGRGAWGAVVHGAAKSQT